MDSNVPVPPAESPGDRAVVRNGKTIGDVLDAILTEPKRCLTLLLLFAVASGLVMLVMLVFTRLFHVQASEVRIGAKDSHVVFEHIETQSGDGEYLVLVSPQGWQATGVSIHAGDKLSLSAGGRVSIDMNSILENVKLRLQYEDAAAKANKIDAGSPKETRVPEDFFTADEKASLRIVRPWVDPDGFSLDTFQPSYQSRRNRYLMPGKPAGGLVGAVRAGSREPADSDAFFVGKDCDLVAPSDGELWFNVNDVRFDPRSALPADAQLRNLYYNDNLGMFWVRIVVKRK